MKVLKAVQHNTMDELNPFRRITFKDLAAVELFHNVASLSNEKTRRFALPLIPENNQIDKFFERRQFRSKMLFFIFEMIWEQDIWEGYIPPCSHAPPRPSSIISDVPESFLSSQSHKPFELEWYKFFQVQSEASHDLAESSQNRITRTVESLQVIGLQARVNGESNEISHFSYLFLLWNDAQHRI